MTPKISRRSFLKVALIGTASATVLTGCKLPQRWVNLEPYVKPPEEQLAGQATWYASTCRQCPAGCGIIVRVMNGRAVKIEGNPLHPLNKGKLCARGQAGLQLLYNPDRLNGPSAQAVRGSRNYQAISWNNALNQLYSKVKDAGSGVAVWLGSTTSGHIYDLFKRFTDVIGAPDPLVFDLYTSLNGYSALEKTGQMLFNQPKLPAFAVGQADMIFSFGANFLGSWLSQVRYGAEYGLFRSQPHGKRGSLVQFEPRMTITGVKADRWFGIKPGTEGLVAQAIIRLIADNKMGPAERVDRARQLASNVDVKQAASASEIPVEELTRLANAFANATRPMAIPGNNLTGYANASDILMNIQALNLIAGIEGQSGGLSPSLDSPLSGFVKPGISPLSNVQSLLEKMKSGEIKVLLVYGANPVFDLPASAGISQGFNVPFVVSFSPMVDETAVWADLILPDRTYLESWGYEVTTPGFEIPAVGGQQPIVTPVFDTRATADVLLDLAKGIPAAADAMPWADEVAFLQDLLDQSQIKAGIDPSATVSWQDFLKNGGWWPAAYVPNPPTLNLSQPASQGVSPTFQGDEREYPYFLQLYLSDLLSDGRGANLPWLQGVPDPMTTIAWQTWVELNKVTAQKIGVNDGDIVTITSPFGQIEAPVYVYPAIREDTIAIPVGQGHSDYGRYALGRGSNPMTLIGFKADDNGNSLLWSNQRVKIRKTDKHIRLAVFADKVGITEGIPNENFPGQ
jgi:anaerobic selenocysteine-containing dehydrogenase